MRLTCHMFVLAELLAGIAARAKRPEYAQLLSDCQRLYCEVRLGLVSEIIMGRIAEYAREPLPSLTRSGCSYLMQVRFEQACIRPHILFLVFPLSSLVAVPYSV